ncbi:lipoprotein [Burkholderia pseudomallei]|nr:lipoprotein [Burkholderia pseudomallei]
MGASSRLGRGRWSSGPPGGSEGGFLGLFVRFLRGFFRGWPVMSVVGWRRPSPGRGGLFFVLPKKSHQKKGAFRPRLTQACSPVMAQPLTCRIGMEHGSRRFRAIAPPGGAVYRPLAPLSLRSDDGHIRAGGMLGFEYLSGDRRTCATRDVRDMKAWFAASRALKLARSANGAPFAVRPRTRLSFGYFSLARQRKVTPAPGRGDANRPLTSQAIHDKPRTTDKRRRPRQKRAKEPRPINPVAIAQDASRAVA